MHALYDDRAVHAARGARRARSTRLGAQLGRPLSLIAESDLNDPLTVTPAPAGGGSGCTRSGPTTCTTRCTSALTGETQGYYADFAAPGALAKVLASAFFHDGT